MKKNEKFEFLINYFSENMQIAETELVYNSPYELLVAVILSAQCTDKRVNQITPDFFIGFPTPEVLSNATQEAVYQKIKSCSYPNNKAKNLIGMAQLLISRFGGIVPESIDDLQMLPGVGRKTANVIASVVFNQPAMAVDTHVFRVSARIGLTTNAKNPLQAEQQLVKFIPTVLIPKAHHWLILHGRYVCKSRNPMCGDCGLQQICDFYSKSRSTQEAIKNRK
ncbi:MAG: endonuclease III [Bacteroidales bacterium]|nr:endonuclease III [Bacteroidales bacterium]